MVPSGDHGLVSLGLWDDIQNNRIRFERLVGVGSWCTCALVLFARTHRASPMLATGHDSHLQLIRDLVPNLQRALAEPLDESSLGIVGVGPPFPEAFRRMSVGLVCRAGDGEVKHAGTSVS